MILAEKVQAEIIREEGVEDQRGTGSNAMLREENKRAVLAGYADGIVRAIGGEM